jgi:hypothetical protein
MKLNTGTESTVQFVCFIVSSVVRTIMRNFLPDVCVRECFFVTFLALGI